ncbi:MAG TPA: molybdopterin dinucleotide binding domain-containing protein [Acidimicrobiales bacterium]|nr:molybdopterin dinucleotide binding domain-containing protein [Acidimicrobiales bacterium]
MKPIGDSRTELWMWREIIKRIDPAMAEEWFDVTEDDAIRMMLEPGGPTEGITLEQLEAGPVRLNVPDPDVAFVEQIRDLVPFPPESLPAPLEKTREFVPTGRIEFYKDDDLFLELDEQVPTYRPPYDEQTQSAETYPLRLLTPHSKWRIHSTYSNLPWLEEVHGGKPRVLISPLDAEDRGIADGDEIEVKNDRGRVVAWAKVSEAAARGTATLTEGWWPRYFAAGKGVNELTSSAVNPIHEIHFVANMWSPSTGWKDCLCEVRRV